MAVYSGAGGRSCPEHQLYRPAIPTAAALAAAPARRTGGDEEKQRREEVDRRRCILMRKTGSDLHDEVSDAGYAAVRGDLLLDITLRRDDRPGDVPSIIYLPLLDAPAQRDVVYTPPAHKNGFLRRVSLTWIVVHQKGWPEKIGTLGVGRGADIAILELEAVDAMLEDCLGQVSLSLSLSLPLSLPLSLSLTRDAGGLPRPGPAVQRAPDLPW